MKRTIATIGALALLTIIGFPLASQALVKCTQPSDCSSNGLTCMSGICDKCNSNNDCTGAVTGPHCLETGQCGPGPGGGGEGAGAADTCKSTSDCQDGQRCPTEKSSTDIFCVSVQIGTNCTANGDADCGKGQTCAKGACATAAAAPEPETTANVPFTAINPTLMIPIPTLNVADLVATQAPNGDISIPYIAVYVAALYKFGVAAAAVLAVIMIMVAGFRWLTAAGNAGAIGEAKRSITSALIGLMLAVGSYTALQVINPDLLSLNPIVIHGVVTDTLDVLDDYTPETESEPGVSGSPSQYDGIFAKYAPCAGVTPDVLKAIATAESGLNAGKTNASGYTGLFQTKAANCPAKVASYCNDLTNPDNNTAAGSAMIKQSVSWISSQCPTASAHDQMVMIYVSHNMGYGMLKYATKKGCDVDTMRQATIDYYVKHPNTARSYAPQYQKNCLDGRDDDQAMAECTAGPKFDYAVKIADKSGVSQVLAPAGGTCPY